MFLQWFYQSISPTLNTLWTILGIPGYLVKYYENFEASCKRAYIYDTLKDGF